MLLGNRIRPGMTQAKPNLIQGISNERLLPLQCPGIEEMMTMVLS